MYANSDMLAENCYSNLSQFMTRCLSGNNFWGWAAAAQVFTVRMVSGLS